MLEVQNELYSFQEVKYGNIFHTASKYITVERKGWELAEEL